MAYTDGVRGGEPPKEEIEMATTRRITKCQSCKQAEAEWAYQPELESFYAIGWHQRGFAVVKVCESCRQQIKGESA